MATARKVTKNNAAPGERKYGLFSLLSLVVGVVIGSGIFVKNESVVTTANSTVGAMIAWGIVSFFILMMVFAFVEIASSTKLSKKPGTMSQWMTDFVSPKAGKFIGIFMLYVYFPIIIYALSMWGAEKILMTAAPNTFEINSWELYGGALGLGLLFMFLMFVMNIGSEKSSKAFGTTGMVLKTIPLFTVIIMAFVAFGTGAGQMPNDVPIDGTDTDFSMIILALPGIMFAFDGFVYSASMQNEAKDQKTFMTAWVGGMLFVITIYIAYSFGIMALQGENAEYTWTLTAAIREWLPEDVSQWFVPLMESIVVISILSGLNGQMIAANKSMASLSAENISPDYRGTYIKLNHQGRPQFAAWKTFAIALIWMVVLTSVDAAWLGTNADVNHMSATNFATDFTAVISFTAYAAIMLGGVWNRKTNKVEVEKKSFFLPTAIIASVGLLLINGYQAYDILADTFTSGAWYKIVVFVLMTLVPLGLMFQFERTIQNNPVTRRRERSLQRFYNAETDPIFLETKNIFMFRYPKSNNPKWQHLRDK